MAGYLFNKGAELGNTAVKKAKEVTGLTKERAPDVLGEGPIVIEQAGGWTCCRSTYSMKG